MFVDFAGREPMGFGYTSRRAGRRNFDNGVPDLQTGVVSDFDAGQEAADNFVLQPGMATITDVHWSGVYDRTETAPTTDNFTIRFFIMQVAYQHLRRLHSSTLETLVANQQESSSLSQGSHLKHFDIQQSFLLCP